MIEIVPATKEGQLLIYATKLTIAARIARRAPSADPTTRTVHVEADIPNPDRRIPVFTTGQFLVGVGNPVPAVELPLVSATVKGSKAMVYLVKDGVARSTPLHYLGELGGAVFVEPDAALTEGTLAVTEGRALLSNGDRVDASLDAETKWASSSGDTGHGTLKAEAKP